MPRNRQLERGPTSPTPKNRRPTERDYDRLANELLSELTAYQLNAPASERKRDIEVVISYLRAREGGRK